MDVAVLSRDMYSEAEAARLLGVAQSTLHYWLDGGVMRGKRYAPVIREKPRKERVVTWGEFVEAGLLAQYRREHDVDLPELRKVIEELRQDRGVPYPLASEDLWIGPGRRVLMAAQKKAGLPDELFLVAVATKQLVLTAPAESFLVRVRWDDALPGGWRPHDDPASPVIIDPDVRFGLPMVSGVKTEVVWEHLEGGEDVGEVAEAFGLSADDVLWGYSYEHSRRARQAA